MKDYKEPTHIVEVYKDDDSINMIEYSVVLKDKPNSNCFYGLVFTDNAALYLSTSYYLKLEQQKDINHYTMREILNLSTAELIKVVDKETIIRVVGNVLTNIQEGSEIEGYELVMEALKIYEAHLTNYLITLL